MSIQQKKLSSKERGNLLAKKSGAGRKETESLRLIGSRSGQVRGWLPWGGSSSKQAV